MNLSVIKTVLSGTRTRFLPIIFIFFLAIVFFYPVIFQGKTFYAFDALLQYLPWSSDHPGFRAHNPLITDPVNQHYPYHRFIKKCIQLKTLPLWKGDTLSGLPLAESCISRYTHPIVFFFYVLFPLPMAHDLLLFFHLFGIGVVMFLFLRELDIRPCPALIGAVSWMFSGYIMVWFEFETIPILALSLPAALCFAERWLKSRKKLHCLCFTGAVAFAICSGFAHLAIYQILFVGAYILCRYLTERRGDKDFPKIGKQDMVMLALGIFIGICISAVFLISHLSLLEKSQRRAFTFEELYQETGKLPGKYLITLIFPDFYGNPARSVVFTPRTRGTQPYNNYNELCIYPGILSLFLIITCIPYIFKRKYVPFFLFSAVIPLTMAMGSILYYPMMKFIPGLSLSTPTRILYIFAFSVSVLAGLGADILLSAGHGKRRFVTILWAAVSLAALVIYGFIQTETGIKWAANYENWKNWDQVYPAFQTHFLPWSLTLLKPICLIFASFLLLTLTHFAKKETSKKTLLLLGVVLLCYDLISSGLAYNTASPKSLAYPRTDAIRFLQNDTSKYRIISYGKFMHNALSPFHIEDVGGYDSFYPQRYGQYLHLSQYGPDAPLPDRFSRWVSFQKFGSPLFDLLNIKYVLTPPSLLIRSERLEPVYDKEIRIYKNKTAFPRVFFVPRYQVYETQKEAYQALGASSASDLKSGVILESHPGPDFQTEVDGEISAKATIISYRPNRIEIDVSADQNGFVVLSDNYDSGWYAETDGETARLLRANYIMRAVPVKAGMHRIVMTYRPSALITGIIISVMGWCVLVVWIGISVIFENRKKII